MGISENRGPQYRTLNSRILIIRSPSKDPKSLNSIRIITTNEKGYPNFGKLPNAFEQEVRVLVGEPAADYKTFIQQAIASGLGFGVQGSGFRVWGSGFRV